MTQLSLLIIFCFLDETFQTVCNSLFLFLAICVSSSISFIFQQTFTTLGTWFCNILSSPTRLLYLPHERRIAVYWTVSPPPFSSLPALPVVTLLLYKKVGKLNAAFGPFSQLKRLLTLRIANCTHKFSWGTCACVLKLYSYHIRLTSAIYLCVFMCLCI